MERRRQIVKILEESKQPVSGAVLAKKLSVSRQVIVQDIALLRAENKNIISTNKGYLICSDSDESTKAQRVICSYHTKEQIREELYTIVALGGRVRKVFVKHDIYGQISADLFISSRKDADEFMRRVEKSDMRPLNCLTDGIHYHLVEADSEELLDEIEKELKEKGMTGWEKQIGMD